MGQKITKILTSQVQSEFQKTFVKRLFSEGRNN